MKAKIVTLEKTKVMGIVYRGKNENNEIPEMWNVFNKRFKEIPNPDMRAFYGLCYGFENGGSFAYMAGLAVDQFETIPNGMEVVERPGGKYAVFTFKDKLEKIGQFWDEIYKTYLKENELTPMTGMTFELYDERFEKTGECDIYIPVLQPIDRSQMT